MAKLHLLIPFGSQPWHPRGRPWCRRGLAALAGLMVCAGLLGVPAWAQPPASPPGATLLVGQAALPVTVFLAVVGDDEAASLAALQRIGRSAHPAHAAMLIDMVHVVPHRRTLAQLIALIERTTGQTFDGDVNALYSWLWARERPVHPDYSTFRAELHARFDPRFRDYFRSPPQASIRLDEIRWGGVRRDGIPPLKNPAMVSAREANWLADGDIVFGVAIDGDVRAYPKRILAWHEMFKDRIAGKELAGVYCTLCGALVLYDTTVNGVQHELGTSGFLYRSNKLMYDHATQSLWSTLNGTPVVGPLVGRGIVLPSLYVVTTTWKEWRTRHPGTRVLSIHTGYQRNYDEGAAYRSYFATDSLMFNVPQPDHRLPNKAEVLALRLPQAGTETLAISADFLATRPVYHVNLGPMALVVLTDASGANRVYDAGAVRFASWDQAAMVRDSQGKAWRMDEGALSGPSGEVLKRMPAHRAFWFGWHAAFPDTRLIKP